MNSRIENLITRLNNTDLLKEVLVRTSTLQSDFEDADVTKSFSKNYEDKIRKELELLKKLNLLHCHFTWNFEDIEHGLSIAQRIERIIMKEDYTCSGKYTIHHLFNFLQLGYYFALWKEFERSLEFLDLAEFVAKTENLSEIRKGLEYVVQGNRAFVLLLKQDYEQCANVLNGIIQHKDLNDVEKAAVLGTYGVTLMELGIDGIEKAVSIFKEALALHPDSFNWHSHLGAALLRIRHWKHYDFEPSDEECNALRKAVELNINNEVMPLLYLAQTLREKGCIIWRRDNNFPDKLFTESGELCDLALLQKDNMGAKALVRLADVYIKLQKYNTEAEICIKQALILDPHDGMVNHKAGIFYEYAKKDFQKALHYFERAANSGTAKPIFHADQKLVELKILLDPAFDPIEALSEMLSKYKEEDHYISSIYMFRGIIYYFKNDQLDRALEDWISAFQKDETRFVGSFKSFRNFYFFKKYFSNVTKDQKLVQNLLYRLLSETDEIKKRTFNDIISICRPVVRRRYFNVAEIKDSKTPSRYIDSGNFE